MYQLLPMWLRNLGLTLFGVFVIYGMGIAEWIGLPTSPYRTASAGAAVFLLGITAIFGWSGYYSPWRWLWRKFPILNSAVYPDLNGVWVGTTRSNWPVIEQLRKAAEADRRIDINTLSEIPLQLDGMALVIDASLFSISIKACAANTRGRSHSLTTSVERFPTKNDVRLSYIYKQETPDPRHTDESSHLGAGTLHFENNNYNTADGFYWTRRSWREGMNTAGQLSLTKVREFFDPKTDDILTFAKRAKE